MRSRMAPKHATERNTRRIGASEKQEATLLCVCGHRREEHHPTITDCLYQNREGKFCRCTAFRPAKDQADHPRMVPNA